MKNGSGDIRLISQASLQIHGLLHAYTPVVENWQPKSACWSRPRNSWCGTTDSVFCNVIGRWKILPGEAINVNEARRISQTSPDPLLLGWGLEGTGVSFHCLQFWATSGSARLTDNRFHIVPPVSMTKNESVPYFAHPSIPQWIWLPQPGERLKQKDWKPRGQMRRGHYYDNNKTTVCHLAIPRATVSRLFWNGATAISLSQGGLKIPRRKELVAWARKIVLEEINRVEIACLND